MNQEQTAAGPPPLVRVATLSKSFGEVEAVRGVSFSVAAGEIYGLLGPNGAGKSTTINILSGLLRADRGTVHIAGNEVADAPEEARRQLGVVPQQSIVIEELSALENCLFFGSLYGVPAPRLRRQADALLEWIGLAEKRRARVSTFSGGQLRRLALVLGLVHEPGVLVLDEPTVGLDPQTRILIIERVQEVSARGTAVLLSTHYLDEAERLCDRIGIIDHGEIKREGTLDELRAAVEDVQLLSLRGSFSADVGRAFAAEAGGDVEHAAEGELTVSLPAGSKVAGAVLERARGLDGVSEISVRPPSLESLFIRLTGRELRD